MYGISAKILSDSPYEFNKINEDTYEIIQEEEDMLRGAYKLVVEFTNTENQWKISNRILELKK